MKEMQVLSEGLHWGSRLAWGRSAVELQLDFFFKILYPKHLELRVWGSGLWGLGVYGLRF